MHRLLLGLAIAIGAAAPAPAQNLLANADFDEAPSDGWQCTPPSGCTHDAQDVDGAAASGSALLVTGSPSNESVVLAQCIEVSPAVSYDFAGWAWVTAANPLPTILRIRMAWYDGPGCSGSTIYSEVLAAAGETGVWTPLARTRPSPPNAASGRFDVQFLKSPAAIGVVSARVDALSVPEPAPAGGVLAALAAIAGIARRRPVA